MKQFLCVVLALVIAVFLAACTSGNNDTTTLAATTTVQTTSRNDSVTTTTDKATTITTTQHETSTTEASEVATSVTDIATTTATIQGTTSSEGVVFYAKHPQVPDYGALIGVEYSKLQNDIYYYKMENIANKDPNGDSGSLYIQVLQDCGYVALSPYDKDGIQGYLYGNSSSGVTILFAAAREQGAIVVAISQ